jgi:hypothetical protein
MVPTRVVMNTELSTGRIEPMQVTTLHNEVIDLFSDEQSRLWMDGEPIVAVREQWGMVGLGTAYRFVYISHTDYEVVMLKDESLRHHQTPMT